MPALLEKAGKPTKAPGFPGGSWELPAVFLCTLGGPLPAPAGSGCGFVSFVMQEDPGHTVDLAAGQRPCSWGAGTLLSQWIV